MKIIPTQLVVEKCIFECEKEEIHTIIRALSEHGRILLKEKEVEKNKNKIASIENQLDNISVLEKALHSYYRIPLVTEKDMEDVWREK